MSAERGQWTAEERELFDVVVAVLCWRVTGGRMPTMATDRFKQLHGAMGGDAMELMWGKISGGKTLTVYPFHDLRAIPQYPAVSKARYEWRKP